MAANAHTHECHLLGMKTAKQHETSTDSHPTTTTPGHCYKLTLVPGGVAVEPMAPMPSLTGSPPAAQCASQDSATVGTPMLLCKHHHVGPVGSKRPRDAPAHLPPAKKTTPSVTAQMTVGTAKCIRNTHPMSPHHPAHVAHASSTRAAGSGAGTPTHAPSRSRIRGSTPPLMGAEYHARLRHMASTAASLHQHAPASPLAVKPLQLHMPQGPLVHPPTAAWGPQSAPGGPGLVAAEQLAGVHMHVGNSQQHLMPAAAVMTRNGGMCTLGSGHHGAQRQGMHVQYPQPACAGLSNNALYALMHHHGMCLRGQHHAGIAKPWAVPSVLTCTMVSFTLWKQLLNKAAIFHKHAPLQQLWSQRVVCAIGVGSLRVLAAVLHIMLRGSVKGIQMGTVVQQAAMIVMQGLLSCLALVWRELVLREL